MSAILFQPILSNPSRSVQFSLLMTFSGAALGPFLDSYHSAFGVLQYDFPITAQLWSPSARPALITTWWVPELFGLAGFLIGWLHIIYDHYFINRDNAQIATAAAVPSKQQRQQITTMPTTWPKIWIGISIFTFQYWLSGYLYANGMDRTTLLNTMTSVAAIGFLGLDGSFGGFLVSAQTAVGGPLIEAFLLSTHIGNYHYTDPGETGVFPLWILPVYFLGGPAVGNLARGFWDLLSDQQQQGTGGTRQQRQQDLDGSLSSSSLPPPGCNVCNDSRCVGCPNCDAVGSYVTYGRSVECNCCKGRGFVMCRECFAYYGEDPTDIEAIRERMRHMPD